MGNIENNNTLENNKSNSITKKELDNLLNDINYSTQMCVKKDLINLLGDLNFNNDLEKNNIAFQKNDINVYREGKKPFNIYNNNVLFLSKNGILVFGDNNSENPEEEFKKNLATFLKDNGLSDKNQVFIYRDGDLIEARKKQNYFIDKNDEIVKIYFGDIISDTKENIENNILDINKIESLIGSIKVNKVSNYKDGFLLNINTIHSNKKNINIYYNKKLEVKLYNNQKLEEIGDFFKNDIKFLNHFNNTFSYFKENNIFDEPINEKPGEQLDGLLRVEAIKALKNGKKDYIFNGIKYDLYKGDKLNLPQVCLDYPLDFYEKFNHSFYKENGEKEGLLDFEQLFGGFFERRRVLHFINYINNNKNDINKYLNLERINYLEGLSYIEGVKTEKFIKEVLSNKLKLGDLIMISGKLESTNRFHNHVVMVSKINQNGTVFIQENAGLPKEINLLEVLSRGPLRKMLYIVKATDLLKSGELY